jgi:hypothetical protein
MLLALLRLHIYCETSVTKTRNFGKPCRIFYVRSNKVLNLFVLEVCVKEVACLLMWMAQVCSRPIRKD